MFFIISSALSGVCSEPCLLPKQRVTTSHPFQGGTWTSEIRKLRRKASSKLLLRKANHQHSTQPRSSDIHCPVTSWAWDYAGELVSLANGRFDASPPCTLLNCFSGVNPSSAEFPDLWKCSVQAGHFLTTLQSFREHVCSFPCLWVEAALLVLPE